MLAFFSRPFCNSMPKHPSVSPSGPPDLPDDPPFDETIEYREGGYGVVWGAAPEDIGDDPGRKVVKVEEGLGRLITRDGAKSS